MKIGIVSGAAYCIPLLQALVNGHLQASVFTDACSGAEDLMVIRHFCNGSRIPLQEGNHELFHFWLREEQPDMVFIMGFKHLIDTARLPVKMREHVYNIHFGALPAYRGPNPVFWQIKNGSSSLTVTIHLLSEQFDAGGVIWSREMKRDPHLSYGTAHLVLSQVVVEGVGFIMQQVFQKKRLSIRSQDNNKSYYYKRPELKDVLIQWENMAAAEIVNLILACNPWNKGAITSFNGNELKILDAEIMENTATSLNLEEPGLIINHHHGLQVTCKDKMIINITMLNLNDTFIPARHAALFGFIQGQFFGR
ncbi:methionyl-tRNA formyltransferase [Pedobacter sp. L105]|uniref:methionyl-tRNA formyltransferase n=1 Tax=Pedobacter sp. L105 TaxID=1641871 RepID=UPI00131B6E36|nr:formyltransferase family protein [Pedobacter sp. L105]